MPVTNQRNGFSTIELLVAGSISAIFILGATLMLSKVLGAAPAANAGASLDDSIHEAQKHIRRIGRVSKNCRKISTPLYPTFLLQCDVDLSIPPSGILTTIQFALSGTDLLYQQFDPVSASWATLITYHGIGSFIICDSVDITTSGGCAIKPLGLNQLITTAAPAARGGFFRYQLSSIPSTENGKGIVRYSAAFFARNFNPISGLVYQR